MITYSIKTIIGPDANTRSRAKFAACWMYSPVNSDICIDFTGLETFTSSFSNSLIFELSKLGVDVNGIQFITDNQIWRRKVNLSIFLHNNPDLAAEYQKQLIDNLNE